MLVTKTKLVQAGRKIWQHQRYHGCQRSHPQCLVADSPVSALGLCTQIRCKQPHCMPAPAPLAEMTRRLRHMAFAIVSHTLTLYQLNYSQTPSLSKMAGNAFNS
ncbi:uncharacterized protein SEPMUDRAFT_116614 [Sphaerulina musiva SO2202]|uniref:Uncharacterized protein n=1 Tax=Sphaerulina musiva (strain SO2202) TaxID=692275 RepID=M3D5Z0_SPHMS|nr:uncharacterized protein SEPMUDRAFT_116614 [Sphaerulina musiva SO2202]EMF13580.1 hypothetical protein SEPMUDRAFT_116614 [Sphaerulina musiva SO2202]